MNGYKSALTTEIPREKLIYVPYHISQILSYSLKKRIFSPTSATIVGAQGYTQLSEQPVYTVHPRFDANDFPPNMPLILTFTFFYAGSLYRGARDITSLLTASNNLQTKGVLKHFPLEVNWYSYPGNIYEFMGTGRLILSIGSKYNLAAKSIEKLEIEKNCETKEEVKEVLLRGREIGEILEKYAK